MNSTSSGLETTITSSTEKNLLNTKWLIWTEIWWFDEFKGWRGIQISFQKAMIWTKQFLKWEEQDMKPQVRHTATRAVEIKLDLTHKIGKKQKTVTYSIVTQHRDHDRINDDISVETEE